MAKASPYRIRSTPSPKVNVVDGHTAGKIAREVWQAVYACHGCDMGKGKKSQPACEAGSATVGYEAQFWEMADTLHNNTDAAEYKHVYNLDNPPFNDSDGLSGLLKDDQRWAFGMPRAGNENVGSRASA